MAPTTPNPKSPDYVRPEVQALAGARTRSRILIDGTDAVHAAGEAILPKWPGETDEFYDVRSTLTELFDAYGRTIEASVGMLFGSDPKIENMPPELDAFLADATGQGVSLVDVGRSGAHEILASGLAGILVDYPRVDAAGLSLRDVQEQQLRPYAVPVEAAQLLSWRTARRGARTYLTQLVLRESHEQPDGDFGVTVREQYRVFRHDLATDMITVAVYGVTEAAGVKGVEVVVPEAVVLGPKAIPFAPGYAMPPKVPLVARPPLDRLAHMNIGHYRVSADHRYMMSICHAPTIKIEGASDDEPPKVKIGPNTVWKLTGEQKGSWMQAEPDALASSERTMERQQQQMGALGMAFLARDRSQTQETATGRTLDAAAEHATLGSLGDGVAEMLRQALVFAAAYLSTDTAPVDVSGLAVSIRPDYDVKALDAQTILALSKLAEINQITLETLLKTLVTGNVLPDSFDVDSELVSLVVQSITAPDPDPMADPVAPRGSAA